MQVSMLFKISYIPQVIINTVEWKSFHSQVKRDNCGRLFDCNRLVIPEPWCND